MTESLLTRAIALSRNGQKEQARQLLKQILEADVHNEKAWLWFADTFDTNEERIRALERCLTFNPAFTPAQKGLEALRRTNPKPQNGPPPVSSTPAPFSGSVDEQQQHNAAAADKLSPSSAQPARKKQSSSRALMYALGGVAMLLALACLLVLGYIIGKGNIPSVSVPIPSPTPSPDQVYVQAMVPALEELDAWFNGPKADWSALMQKQVPGQSSTYGSEFESYIWMRPIFTGPDIEASRKRIAVDLVPASRAIADEGFSVLALLGAAEPPPTVKVAHDRVVVCIEWEVEKANAIADLLNTGGIPELSEDPCDQFPAALTRVRQFVSEHK